VAIIGAGRADLVVDMDFTGGVHPLQRNAAPDSAAVDAAS